jgi:transcriptional regulator NrdR family protein
VIRCPTCQSETSVLLVRGERRRRECPQGHRFTTRETLIGGVDNSKAVLQKLAAAQKAMQ